MSGLSFSELQMYVASDPGIFDEDVRRALLDVALASHKARTTEDATDEAWLDFALARFIFEAASSQGRPPA